MSEKTLKLIKDNDVKWVDLRFTDSHGKEQHVTLPVGEIDDDFFQDGKMFDGSSIAGWKGINESDMILLPEDETAVLDPFTDVATLNLRCNIVEPTTMQGYDLAHQHQQQLEPTILRHRYNIPEQLDEG